MKSMIRFIPALIIPTLFFSLGCDLLSDEDTDLCTKYKRPDPLNQAWRIKLDVFSTYPYPLEDHKLMYSNYFIADITVRLMNCERVEADYRQITYQGDPSHLVPIGAYLYTFNLSPAYVFSTSNEADYLSIQYHLFTSFTWDQRAFNSDTLWFDITNWTTMDSYDTFDVYLSVPSLWYEEKK